MVLGVPILKHFKVGTQPCFFICHIYKGKQLLLLIVYTDFFYAPVTIVRGH